MQYTVALQGTWVLVACYVLHERRQCAFARRHGCVLTLVC